MGGPDPAELLRQMENPNFLQQMNEAMNNPAVIDMLMMNPMVGILIHKMMTTLELSLTAE